MVSELFWTPIPCTFWTTKDSPIQLVTHIRCSSVDNTELIDGNDLSSSPQKWKDTFPFPSHYKHQVHGIRDVHFHWSCPQRRDPVLHSACTCPYHFFSDPRPRNDQCPCANKNSYFLSMQCRCTLTCRWLVLGNAQVHTFISVIMFLDLSENLQRSEFRENSTRTPSDPHQFGPILHIGMNAQTNRFSPSMRLRDFHWFCPCTTLSQRIRRFLSKSSFSKNYVANRSRIVLAFLSDPWPSSLSHRTNGSPFVVADSW